MTTADARPQTKAADLIARDLCQKIVEGALKEGDLLPAEADLMNRYGVSRAVMREAMRLLEWDSFVTIRRGAGGGARITLPDARVAARYCGLLLQAQGTTLEDVDAALTTVEPEIVGLIAESPAPSTEILELALRSEARVIENSSAFVLAGSHFHELLPTALGNKTLTSLLGIVREIRERHNIAALTGTVDEGANHRRTHATHREVLDLMDDRSVAEARSLWVRHLHATSRTLAKTPAKTVLDLFTVGSTDMDWGSAPRGARRMTRLPKGADIVAGQLRRRIIGGEMVEGASVPTESALMEQFGLSRPSVREALRILEAEHLVQPIRGSHHGGRVRLPNVETAVWHTGLLLQRSGSTVGQLLEAQRVLERCISQNLVEADLPGLAESLGGVGAEWGSEATLADRIGCAIGLFGAVTEQTSNATLRCLTTIGRALVWRCVVAHGLEATRGTGWSKGQVERWHRELLDLARQGDLAGVIAAWRDDSERCYQRLHQVLDPSATIDMFA